MSRNYVQEKYKKVAEESIYSSTFLSDPDLEADVESICTEIKSCLIMLVTLYVVGRKKIANKQEKHAGGMRQ